VLTATASPLSGGAINANPAPDCNGGLQYTSGTNVTLTAIPNGAALFTGWSGDATGTTNPIQVTLNGDKIITANFKTWWYFPFVTK
jgi:uncharacterized repeat protein (TIGR02543 family)